MTVDQSDWRVRRFDEAQFEHPESEAQLIALVQRARGEGAQLRFRGSAHSVAAGIYTDGFDPEKGPTQTPGAPVINVMLDKYRAMVFSESGGQHHVTVEAGRSLGGDPFGPGDSSDAHSGLVHAIAARGLALPVLGGISHQTISGFLSTGSAGASLKHAFHDAIVSIRIIDGTGVARDIASTDPEFAHVGVSLGLLGVISTVTLALESEFIISGWSSVQQVGDCEIDLFGDGDATRPSLRAFFEAHDYARLLYWPQSEVDRVEIWTAQRAPKPVDFEPDPFEQFEAAPRFMQWFVRFLYTHVLPHVDVIPGDATPAVAEAWLSDRIAEGAKALGLPSPAAGGPFVAAFSSAVSTALATADESAGEVKQFLVRELIQAIVSTSKKRPGGAYERARFQDTWYDGIPHDNQMDDQLMPVLFTELWVEIDKAPTVMRALRDYWADGRLSRTGTFATEIYPAPASPFTLSAAKGTPVLRIDPFVFWRQDGKPEDDYFPGYWELLRQFDARFHWGKTLSLPGSSTGAAYRRERAGAADWDAFLSLRESWDPDDIFLTHYWRAHLGI